VIHRALWITPTGQFIAAQGYACDGIGLKDHIMFVYTKLITKDNGMAMKTTALTTSPMDNPTYLAV
jgi:hypothetical protein